MTYLLTDSPGQVLELLLHLKSAQNIKSAQNMVAMMMMPMWSRLVAEVLGGVDINWSPPITDWSHHYGNYDGYDDENDDDD